jgi:hypothetical protein
MWLFLRRVIAIHKLTYINRCSQQIIKPGLWLFLGKEKMHEATVWKELIEKKKKKKKKSVRYPSS